MEGARKKNARKIGEARAQPFVRVKEDERKRERAAEAAARSTHGAALLFPPLSLSPVRLLNPLRAREVRSPAVPRTGHILDLIPEIIRLSGCLLSFARLPSDCHSDIAPPAMRLRTNRALSFIRDASRSRRRAARRFLPLHPLPPPPFRRNPGLWIL